MRRAVFYSCRLISSQKETEFTGEDYGGIKKVYTIWIVIDVPQPEANSIISYSLSEKILYGQSCEKMDNYDLMTVVMVRLGQEKTDNRFLKALRLIFLDKLKAAEKKKILSDEYGVQITPDMDKEMTAMGSLADVLINRARNEAYDEGRSEERLSSIRNLMQNMGWTAEQAMKNLGIPAAEQAQYAAQV